MEALLSTYSAGTPLAEIIPAQVSSAYHWIAVRQRFDQFHQKLQLTLTQKMDGCTKLGGVLRCLNQHYCGSSPRDANGLVIGSWGKDTATRPPRDVDAYFILPPDVFLRFERRVGNRQSALLQEVRGVLLPTYPDTRMRADGQVVLVDRDNATGRTNPLYRL